MDLMRLVFGILTAKDHEQERANKRGATGLLPKPTYMTAFNQPQLPVSTLPYPVYPYMPPDGLLCVGRFAWHPIQTILSPLAIADANLA